MASYYRRKNGTYCVRVSNGWKDGKQELISATYKPPKDFTEKEIQRGVKEFAELFEASTVKRYATLSSNPFIPTVTRARKVG